ncbi:fumarylacetoacetate hydrolase family protein [Fundidesulfovibrio agrisoli]|uniref:fumarylacetoacetate hydrolase family protein n=1 Tax=Fundidesulfovibrio agrisoli TaxID=2922717 RepID=UPI001FAD2716|nr:fumarylacetoacetate hydrolase family protein [Fundidesulfovibrio agrisoli]
MRLAMISREGRTGLALCKDGEMRALFEGDGSYPGSLEELLAAGADLRAAGAVLENAPQVDMAGVRWLPPVRRPGKIVCVGLNYRDHSKETGYDVPDYPTLFLRFTTTLVGHGEPIVRPAVSTQLDYEGELAVVIGRKGHAIPKDQALEHVAGYSLFNDASIRDYQFRTPQWTVGKNFDGTGPFGPWLVTPEELPPGCAGLGIQTRLNGTVMQKASIDDMMFDVASLVSIISEVATLEPGDVIVTGTPAGIGFARDPKVFMAPGDVCEVEVEGVGVLRNGVADAV